MTQSETHGSLEAPTVFPPYPVEPVEMLEFTSPIGWSVQHGSLTPSGKVRLRFRGKEATGMATGNGNIDALFKAMMDAARQLQVFHNGDVPELADWDLRSCGQGSEAPGVAKAEMAYHGERANSQLADPNSIHASMFVYLNCMNVLVRRLEAFQLAEGSD